MGTVKNIEFVNINDLSMFLDVGVNTLYYWVQLKKIPYYKFGKHLRFSVEEINTWVEEKRVPPKMYNSLFTFRTTESMIDEVILTVVRNLNGRRLQNGCV